MSSDNTQNVVCLDLCSADWSRKLKHSQLQKKVNTVCTETIFNQRVLNTFSSA